MELDLISISYLFFRLAPFILASFFSLSSIFNQDIKGIIYLVGLILAAFINVIFTFGNSESDPLPVCNIITVGNTATFSQSPISLCILTYTFIYLVFAIATYNVAINNIPTLILFPLLILADFIWNYNNQCYSFTNIVKSFIVGGGIGALWGWVVVSYFKSDAHFIGLHTNAQICSRPSKTVYKCTFKK